MCGIVGVINRDGLPVSKKVLWEMTRKLSHRGPDGEGIWTDLNVGLGHTRLKVVGDCQQPLARNWWALTYNGEIYNQMGSGSDVNAVIDLYRDHNTPRMFDRMNGMFAFGLWDRTNKKLILARDRFGEKPLYWYRDENVFLFASEIKAILAHPSVIAELNPPGVDQYMQYQYTLGQTTMFKGIQRLIPGTYMEVDRHANRIEYGSYWRLPHENKPEDDDLDHLADLITDSVRIRTRSDVPMGAYVSGGIDSSLVYKLAGSPPAYTGFYPTQSEVQYADQVVNGNKHFLTEIIPFDVPRYLEQMIYHMDEPTAGPGLLGQYMVAKTVAASGVTVVLGGQGADELFGGYARNALCGRQKLPDGYQGYDLKFPYKGMTMSQSCRYDIGWPLQALLHVEDRCSMAHGVETRLPYLDHRIAELVFSRSTALRWHGGERKGALKHVSKGLVPDAILDRTDKMGFTTPFVEWSKGPLREYIGDILGDTGPATGQWDRGLWGRLNLAVWKKVFKLGNT